MKMNFGKVAFTVTSLSCGRVMDKLAKEGIAVFSVRKRGKNTISFCVAAKDREKVFAILRGSCYNIDKVRGRGLNLFYEKCKNAMGLLLGALLFCLIVLYSETRVLRIDVVGSGAYFEPRILELLEESGVKRFSRVPADCAAISSSILALPRVSYCSIGAKGGVLTVEVRVSEESETALSGPLRSPATGTVEEIFVLRGTAAVKVGDEVEEGQVLVENFSLFGEEKREVLVIARVTVSFPVSETFEGSEEQAKLSAYLKYGTIEGIKTEAAEGGFLVTGKAYQRAAVNLS